MKTTNLECVQQDASDRADYLESLPDYAADPLLQASVRFLRHLATDFEYCRVVVAAYGSLLLTSPILQEGLAYVVEMTQRRAAVDAFLADATQFGKEN